MSRHYFPRAFGLLFAANELIPAATPPASHFIEGTLYQEEGQPGHNACGRAETRRADQPPVSVDFDTLADLAAKIGLDQAGLNRLVSRITTAVSRQ